MQYWYVRVDVDLVVFFVVVVVVGLVDVGFVDVVVVDRSNKCRFYE